MRLVRRARDVIASEASGLAAASESLDDGFAEAVELVLGATGRVVLVGVGKSGLVARKIAATLTSTGSPAVFMHAVDAAHGDLGVLRRDDVAILCSKTGATEELLRLVPALERVGVPIVVLTARADSPLARAAGAIVRCGDAPEAGSVSLVPTTSTTAMLAVGDALAVVVMEERGFREADFAFLHPGGVIGRQIARRVRDVMAVGEALPRVPAAASLRDALVEILRGALGMTTVVDDGGKLVGVLTDGDLKRILLKHENPMALPVGDVMSREPKTIGPDALVASAVERMENNPRGAITSLVVVDPSGVPIGVVHLHECLRP